MSAGEALDEAAKDAADIAAFFKSGKSERGESGSGRAPVAPLDASGASDVPGEMRTAWNYLPRFSPMTCQGAAFNDTSSDNVH
ncbi:unnamed protein product [Tetraodon nigroviridis]|uniref:(spotted green pufferfish) hypothetical protein n=1 Tax=Tetraodon nigroviridis TaxID=99883 RepID=Q4RFK3_TETNG|nr:unnamed protein product [Tetraodon nigroviridis]